MTVEQLRQLCQTYNIRQGKKKVDYVTNVAARIKTVHCKKNELATVVSQLRNVILPDSAPLHTFYRDWFNLVDLTDGYWYAVEEHHKNNSWRSKMLFGIMRHFIFNVWVFSSTLEYKPWIKWCSDLAEVLMNFFFTVF